MEKPGWMRIRHSLDGIEQVPNIMISRHLSLPGRRKSESLPGRGRKRSPVPVRKVQGEVSCPPPSTVVQSTTSGPVGTLPHGLQGPQEEMVAHGPIPNIEDDFINLDSTGNLSNGSSTEFLEKQIQEDVVDSGSVTPDYQRTKAAIERVHQKMEDTKSMISVEQKVRDENVNEYLKLASNADKQQLQRIKNVFEKKNQKSAQTIAQLQKKLENYTKRIRDLERSGYSSYHHHRQPKEVLRDVGQGLKDVGANIRDGITGFSGGVVGNIKGGLSGLSQVTHNAADINITSDDECSSVTSGSGPTAGTGTMSSPRNQPHVQAVSPALVSLNVTAATASNVGMSLPMVPQANVHLEDLLQKLQEKQDEWQRLQDEVESLKAQISQEIAFFNSGLQEERYRYERLEEQMNDLIELHQNEIENLKQNISDMEEKLQYQSEERLRDIYEMMESCQTRISRIEHQQHEQQQLVTLEGIENSNARALVLKLINVVLVVLQVILFLVATASNILMPFLKTRVRILTTTVLIIGVLFAAHQWHHLTAYLWELFHYYKSTHATK